jgi:hypothetical protein
MNAHSSVSCRAEMARRTCSPQLCTGSDASKRRMRSGMRNSADQPSARRDTRASQFSSQSEDQSVSLKRIASERTPAALIASSKALVPPRRESRTTVIESASMGRSRRVSRPTIGADRCSQSTPIQIASRS